MEPYYPPVSPSLYGFYAAVLLICGFIATAAFCVNPYAQSKKMGVGLIVQLSLAAIASGLLGFGTLFVFLYSGIYV